MNKTPASIFVEIMAKERRRRKIAVADLAERLNLPPKVLVGWEAGKKCPRLSSAMRWGAELGFSLELRGPSNG